MDGQETRSAWTYKSVVELVSSIPEISSWPHFDHLLGRPVKEGIKPSWEYVCHACEAVGGDWQIALPGAAAILCLHYSIHLVDDVLDEDPLGLQHSLGPGHTSNLATAFQAAAGLCLDHIELGGGVLERMHRELHQTVIGTGFGQYLDSQETRGEEDYWRITRHKTPPLFCCALYWGALTGGCPEEPARKIRELGMALGEIAQINDDLGDAMERPAKTDWQRRYGCLPIVFARLAEHPEKGRFVELADRLMIDLADGAALEEAQEILVRSGALSYCAFSLVEAYRKGMSQLESLDIPAPGRLVELFDYQLRPLHRLFNRLEIDGLDRLLRPA